MEGDNPSTRKRGGVSLPNIAGLRPASEFSSKTREGIYENLKNSCYYPQDPAKSQLIISRYPNKYKFSVKNFLPAIDGVSSEVSDTPAQFRKMQFGTSDTFAQFRKMLSEASDVSAQFGKVPSEVSDTSAQFGNKPSETSDTSAQFGIMPSEASDTSAHIGKMQSEASDTSAQFGIMPSEPSDAFAQVGKYIFSAKDNVTRKFYKKHLRVYLLA